jgi:uncharacterized membrane protein YgdD (TMEM256/DUF423 family)
VSHDLPSPARRLAAVGALLAAAGVGAGAFAAHGLRDRLEPRLLEIFHTGAHYHLVHAVGVLVVAALARHLDERAAMRAVRAGWLLVAGVAVFSGSLYALALTGVRALGAVTPIGGVAFVAGWVLLALALLNRPR